MVNVHGVARLGVLAVGLGIGAVWSQTPVAAADSSGDWLSTIDSLLSGASPAAATPVDLDISFDGYTIYDGLGSAQAVTTTGDYSLAIAYGADAYAATGGTGDVAIADGSGALAWAIGGTGNVAEAVGTNANAWAGAADMITSGADYDTAIDIGNNDVPAAYGSDVGAYAGWSNLTGSTDGGTGVHDTAIDIGNNTGNGANNGAFAGAGGLVGAFGDGNNDTAIDVSNNSLEGDGSFGVGGNGDYAYVDGPANSEAFAAYSDSDIAYIDDPFGAIGVPDSAISGLGYSNDLAEVLFAHGNTIAATAPLLYDIVSLFGNFSGSF
jgi:hypothetical protein